jgi:hypothetical protein
MRRRAEAIYLCETCGKPCSVDLVGGEIILIPCTFITFGIHPNELQESWGGQNYPFTRREFHFCQSDSIVEWMKNVIDTALDSRIIDVDEPKYYPGKGHWITAVSKRNGEDTVLFNIQLSKEDFLTAMVALRKIPFFSGRV